MGVIPGVPAYGYDSRIAPLSNGNYVVESPVWNSNRGAVTWGSGTTGVSGTVSDANSLVGSTPNDKVGERLTLLSDGNYIVPSPFWNNNRGAATWGDGRTGVSGAVSAANSLVGRIPGDYVGLSVNVLSNGNYVITSWFWNDYRGAATWGDGRAGITGIVSAANSLVGSHRDDWASLGGVVPLSNGNYVIASPNWNSNRGAVTWGNGRTGIIGTISDANSLVGSTSGNDPFDPRFYFPPYGDEVGRGHVTPLSNGNYVVSSPDWNGLRGAVTWVDGTMGLSGTVSAVNSLVGSSTWDLVGAINPKYRDSGVMPLSNGNYVVRSPDWNGDRGAVTWGNGNASISGTVSDLNSLVGSSPGDDVGYADGAVILLSNGNYVVRSSYGTRGAVTWGDGRMGISGPISEANSLVGGNPNDLGVTGGAR